MDFHVKSICQKKEINKARFLSVSSDGQTDAGILEEEAVCIRYILKGSALTQFAGVKNPNKADAAGILKVINEELLILKSSDTWNDEEYLDKVYAKLINCNFDGVSAMSGSVSGVWSPNENERKAKFFNS